MIKYKKEANDLTKKAFATFPPSDWAFGSKLIAINPEVCFLWQKKETNESCLPYRQKQKTFLRNKKIPGWIYWLVAKSGGCTRFTRNEIWKAPLTLISTIPLRTRLLSLNYLLSDVDYRKPLQRSHEALKMERESPIPCRLECRNFYISYSNTARREGGKVTGISFSFLDIPNNVSFDSAGEYSIPRSMGPRRSRSRQIGSYPNLGLTPTLLLLELDPVIVLDLDHYGMQLLAFRYLRAKTL